jgi:sugar lactone lactonase YvrE
LRSFAGEIKWWPLLGRQAILTFDEPLMIKSRIANFALCVLNFALVATALPRVLDAQTKIYWTDVEDDRVYRSNFDGTNRQTLFASPANMNADLLGMDLDPAAGKVYWAGAFDGLPATQIGIRRANLDGTIPGIIPIEPPGASSFVEDVALNRSTGYLYAATQGGVIRVKTDGTGVQGPFANRGSEGVTVDAAAGKVYWTEYDLDRIMRSNLDGTGIEVLFTYPANSNNNPVDIEVDHDRGFLFWTNPIAHQIVRSDLNGGGVTAIRTVDGFPEYMDIDRANGLIYFTNNTGHRIERIDENGANDVTIISGLTDPIGVRLGPEFAVPEPSAISLGLLAVLSAGMVRRPWKRYR